MLNFTSLRPARRRPSRLFLGSFLSICALASTSCAQAAPPQVGDKAPAFALKNLQDTTVKLASQLKKGPVVLLMLRGFPGYQCPICNQQVGSFLSNADQFKKAGAQVILVYPGPSDGLKQHADEFVRGKSLPANFHLLLDPNYQFTKRYNLRWDAPGETAYPSTFVVDRQGKIRFAKVSRSHGDRATPDEVLKVLEK